MRTQDGATEDELDWWASLLTADGNLLSVVAFLAMFAVVVLMVTSLIVIRRSGNQSPPVITVVMVLGVVTLASLVSIVVRPELDGLIAVIGTSLGGLAAAVTLAFERDGKHDVVEPPGNSGDHLLGPDGASIDRPSVEDSEGGPE